MCSPEPRKSLCNCLYKYPVLHAFVIRTHGTDGFLEIPVVAFLQLRFSIAQVKSNFRNKLSGDIAQVSLLECDLTTAAHYVTQHAHSPV